MTDQIRKAAKGVGEPKQKQQGKALKSVKPERSLHKFATQQSCSSSEEEEDTVETGALFESVFKSYSGDAKDLKKTQQFLENVFQSGAATCLICIGKVKRSDRIWSCSNCYCFFHLACIQRWANDSMAQKRIGCGEEGGYYTNTGEYVPKRKIVINWDCPQCRYTFNDNEVPREYTCFCGKEFEPTLNLWSIPHSCGEACGLPLKPECGHKCVLLCHPGPCPSCPQIISKNCECGQSGPKTIRCSNKSWNCGKKCPQTLSCGIHKCSGICHDPSSCKPCPKKSSKRCLCGKKSEERSCSEKSWQCGQICGKSFDCGLHICNRVCHEGPSCGPCNLGLPRSCPCGKQTTTANCSEQIESCGDTCLKKLDCGIHDCLNRCHKGPCSKCMEIVEKKCRCGLHSKEIPCSKPFICETKCKQHRNCKEHPCNRKCCDGNCPPCDRICDKFLLCNKHKCKSLCHSGPCYPCNVKSNLKCRCGGTVIQVPCSHTKKIKPPKCHLPCRRPSKCHHKTLHTCHENECPPCAKVCDLSNDTTNCSHKCQAKCHDSVMVKIVDKNFKPVGPWDIPEEVIEFQKLPHPKCELKVPVTCLGGHETILWACYDSKSKCCGRNCGRKLNCGNHECQKLCHVVADLKGSEADEKSCSKCEKFCGLPRPNGCPHGCKKPCHPPPCDPCNRPVKSDCHCGLLQKVYICSDIHKNELDDQKIAELKEEMLSCGNKCIKNLSCGHRCPEKCHSGSCPSSDVCKKKSKVSCKCKNRKMEVLCEKIKNDFVLDCDENCKQKMEKEQQLEDERIKQLKAEEDERNRIELEAFQEKYGNKKPKERKVRRVESETSTNKTLYFISAASLFAIAAILAYFFLYKNM